MAGRASTRSAKRAGDGQSLGPRVLVCGLGFPAKVDGGVTNATALVSALAETMGQVYLAAFWLIGLGRPNMAINHHRVKVFTVPIVEGPWPLHAFVLFLYSVPFLLIVSFLKAFKKLDIVFVSDTLLAYGLVRFKWLHSLPVVVRYTSLEEMDSNEKIGFSLLRRAMMSFLYKVDEYALSKADAVVAPSFHFADVLRARHKAVSEAKILVVPPVIKLESARGQGSSHRPVGEELRVGYVGSFLPYQGVDILIEAMPEVQRRIPQTVLYLIGGDGARSNSLRQRAKEFGVNAVFTGPLPHKETLELLRTFHCVVASRRRNLATELLIPMKLLEAFSLGIPIIITRHRGLERFLQHKIDVVFVEPTPKDLSVAIVDLLVDAELRNRLSSSGAKTVQLFDAARNAARLSSLFREILSSEKQGSKAEKGINPEGDRAGSFGPSRGLEA